MCASSLREPNEYGRSLEPPRLREFRWRTDREAVLAFQTEIYETNFPGFRMNKRFLRDYEQQLRDALRHPSECLLVLEDAEGVCGFLWLALVSTMVEPLIGYIKNIYVAPRLRGKGYGRLLLEAADDWFRSRGCPKVALDASVCNQRAVRIYQAAGYRVTRLRMEKPLYLERAKMETPKSGEEDLWSRNYGAWPADSGRDCGDTAID